MSSPTRTPRRREHPPSAVRDRPSSGRSRTGALDRTFQPGTPVQQTKSPGRVSLARVASRAVSTLMRPRNLLVLCLVLIPGTVFCLSHIDGLQRELHDLQDSFVRGMEQLRDVQRRIDESEQARVGLRQESEREHQRLQSIVDFATTLHKRRVTQLAAEAERAEALKRDNLKLEETLSKAREKLVRISHTLNSLMEQSGGGSVDLLQEQDRTDRAIVEADDALAASLGPQATEYKRRLDKARWALQNAEAELHRERDMASRKINFRKREHAALKRANAALSLRLQTMEREMSKLKQKSVDDRNAKAANLKTAEAKAADIEEAEKFNERGDPSSTTPPPPIDPDTAAMSASKRAKSFIVGSEVMCESQTGVWRTCKVLEVGGSSILVHYVGFSDRYNERIIASSPRLRRPPTTDTPTSTGTGAGANAGGAPSAGSSDQPATATTGQDRVQTFQVQGSSVEPPSDSLSGGGWLLSRDVHSSLTADPAQSSGDQAESALVKPGYAGSAGRGTFVMLKFSPVTLYRCTDIEVGATVDAAGDNGQGVTTTLAVLLSRDGKRFTQFSDGIVLKGLGASGSQPATTFRARGKNPLTDGHRDGELFVKFLVAQAPDPLQPLYYKKAYVTLTSAPACHPTIVAVTTPLADPTKGPRIYLGCFSTCIGCGDHVLAEAGAGMTVDYCEILCRQRGYSFMSLSRGDKCMCASREEQAMPDQRKQISEDRCQSVCTGDALHLCGGANGEANLYALTEESGDLALKKSLQALTGDSGTNDVVLKLGDDGGPQQVVSIDAKALAESGGNVNEVLAEFQRAISQLTGGPAGGVNIQAGNIRFQIGPHSLELKGGAAGAVGSTASALGAPPSDTGAIPPGGVDGIQGTAISHRWEGQKGARGAASEEPPSQSTLASKRDMIKAEFLWAWNAYKRYAWGHDDVKPLTMTYDDNYGLGLTLVDSMDTLLLMGLDSEFDEAQEWVSKLKFDHQHDINLFETTIRVIGGMLGAHALRPEGTDVLVRKATELADAMIFAFDTPTGIPYGTVDLKNKKGHNPSWTAGHSSVAEVGSIQLEFRYLSALTGDVKYKHKADRATDALETMLDSRGLFTQFISPQTGRLRAGVVTLGARVDSVYEYFLKQWIMSKGTDKRSRQMYDTSIRLILEELTLRSNYSGLTFVAEKNGHTLLGKMDHLVCFLPGVLALDYSFQKSIHGKGDNVVTGPTYLEIAEELGETCYQFYARTETKLAPEIVQFRSGFTEDFVVDSGAAHSLLRPEAVESFYHLHRATGDAQWREKGWAVFQALRKWARVETGGYANLKDVRWTGEVKANQADRMESFFLSETMKYLYLLFLDDATDPLPIERFVLNTEAHPFPVESGKNGA